MNKQRFIAENSNLWGEVWRLRELIDEAPHDLCCMSIRKQRHDIDGTEPGECSCWKKESDSQAFYEHVSGRIESEQDKQLNVPRETSTD